MSIRDHKIYFVTLSFEYEKRIPVANSLDGETLPTGLYIKDTIVRRIVAPNYNLGDEIVRSYALDSVRHMGYKNLTVENIISFVLDAFIEKHSY